LQEILRNEWGFTGHIVSDCWAITDFNNFHKVTKNEVESAVMAAKSGVNLNCGVAYRHLAEAVKQGLLTEQQVDRDLAPLLRTRLRLGLLDPPGSNPYDTIPVSVVNCDRHRALAREAAVKSIVLLKNNGVLPLKKELKRIIVTGPLAADVDVLLGNYNGVTANAVTILEGITAKVDAGTRISYHHGFLLTEDSPKKPRWVTFDVNNADATILVLGINPLWEGEEGEAIATKAGADKEDIRLPDIELKYLREMARDHKKPLIVVVAGGSPLDLAEVCRLADAALFAWYPGEEGGNAVADVLFGDVSPSGRLPVNFPYSVDQLPPFKDYSMEGRTYKYMKPEPLFPFGFGLSYTTFSYSAFQPDKISLKSGEELTVSATVTNTGITASDEVVQLYLSHRSAPFRVPAFELQGFSRIPLNPGESSILTFHLSPDDLKVINMEGEKVFLPGLLDIYVGGSLPTARSRELGSPVPVKATVQLVE